MEWLRYRSAFGAAISSKGSVSLSKGAMGKVSVSMSLWSLVLNQKLYGVRG